MRTDPNVYANKLVKLHGKEEAKKVAESALKSANAGNHYIEFWQLVNNILKKNK